MRFESGFTTARVPASAAKAGGLAEAAGAIIASAFGVRRAELRTAERGSRRAALARQVAMYVACTKLGMSFTASGRAVGRDRTTAAHACRAIEDRRDDPALDAIVDCIERAIDRLVDGEGEGCHP